MINIEEKTTTALLVQDKSIVSPGDIVAVGMDWLPSSGCFRVGENIKSKYVGLVRIKDRYISVIPLAGVYMPRAGDYIIGKVIDIQSTFWIVEINSPYDALLQLGEAISEYVDITKTDISTYFDIGDIIYAKILSVNKAKQVQLTMNERKTKKLIGGRIVKISPSKVSRLIGKEGSMIELIKNKTGCQIVAGQNGVVWLKGQNEQLAEKIIKIIEEQSHLSGLTDRIIQMFTAQRGG
mgnify:CR=1 FL=1